MDKIKPLIIYPIDNICQKFGGIESIIQDLVRYAPPNFDIEIVGVSIKKQGLKIGKWHNIIFQDRNIKFFPVLEIEDPNARNLMPLILRFVLALLRWRHRIDFKERLIIFHRLEPSYILRDIKEKKVLFVHGNIRDFGNKYCKSKWKKIKSLYYFIEPFFITQMKKIFVVSQTGCKYYKKRYSEYLTRFQFLPTWYDSHVFYRVENIDKKSLLCIYKIPDKKKLILAVSRLDREKDPILLVKSFFFINNRYPNSHLIIVGEGQLKRKIIKQINDLNLTEKVTLLGQKSAKEIAQLMNISNLLILTSAFEGMPCVVQESLACGLPVVSTDIGEVRLVVKIGMSGKIVNMHNPMDIADAAIEVISNRPSPFLCKSAVENYSHEKILGLLYEELKKLANEAI